LGFWIERSKQLRGVEPRLSSQEDEKLDDTVTSQNNSVVTPPLEPGWSIAYRDQCGALRGGTDQGESAIVKQCIRAESGWKVILADKTVLPISSIVSVAQVVDGHVVAAWTVRGHGWRPDGS
jgi:3D (Asp-Asp-Asp) domain-containing protein